MTIYLRNVWLWLTGFAHFHELTFKPGWGATSAGWWALYTIDYGFNTIFLAGQVVSVSRYIWIRRTSRPWSWLAAGFDRFFPGHIEMAGSPLWDSTECPPWIRIVIPLLWIGLYVGLRYGKWF